MRPLGTWLCGSLLAALLIALALAAQRPPRPAGLDAAVGDFSEARAMPIVRELSETIGLRLPGTAGGDRAARYLLGELGRLPRIEARLQEARGAFSTPHGPLLYQVQNVLARLPGTSRDALLLSAHYDSGWEGPGAADDALAVAALLEVARALTSRPVLAQTVIFCLNGGEEWGHAGAEAFIADTWFKDVRAFINLDATGARGKAMLFQASPGAARLAATYAAAAPRPLANVVGQDLFQGGLLPAGTDFARYDRAGIPGLDLALVWDGYVYHTARDRPERLEPGTLQQLGESVLASARRLAGEPLTTPGTPPSRARVVYYDLLGLVTVVYSSRMAAVLAFLALALLLVAVARTGLRPPALARGLLVQLCACAAGLLAALAGAFVLSRLLGRPHGWYASPALAGMTFGPLALSGALGVHGLFARRIAGPKPVRWASALVLLALLYGVVAAKGMGSAYLFFWCVAPGAACLLLATRRPRWRLCAAAVAFALAALVLTETGLLLLGYFVPLAGRIGRPADPLVAALVALPVLIALLAASGFVLETNRLSTASLCALALGLVCIGITALRSPYSSERPKRLLAVQRETPRDSTLTLESQDALGLGAVLAASHLPASRGVAPSDAPPPRVQIEQRAYDARTGLRTVTLHISHPLAWNLVLELPRGALAGWGTELGPLPVGAEPRLTLLSPRQPWTVELHVRGKAPVTATLEAHLPERTRELEQAVRAAPPWTTISPLLLQVTPVSL